MAMTLTELTRRLKHLERRIHRLEEDMREAELRGIRTGILAARDAKL